MKGVLRRLSLAVILLGMFLLDACAANREVVPASPTSTVHATATRAPALTLRPSLAPLTTISPTGILAHQTATQTPDYFPDSFVSETPFTPTPSPKGALCYNSAYVADVTFPDGSIVEPSQRFLKTWRLQNIGTCAWPASYTLNFVYGKQMSGATMPIGSSVLPGEQIDVSVRLTAPNCEGNKHTGYWQLANDAGRGFGVRVYVVVNVMMKETRVPPPICTPVRTSTP